MVLRQRTTTARLRLQLQDADVVGAVEEGEDVVEEGAEGEAFLLRIESGAVEHSVAVYSSLSTVVFVLSTSFSVGYLCRVYLFTLCTSPISVLTPMQI